MIVYLDILFFINLIMNYIVLILTSSFGSIHTKRIKIFLGAFFGAIYGVFAFLYPHNQIIKILVGLFISYISFGYKSFIKNTILFFGVSFCIAGSIMAIFYFTSTQNYMVVNGIYYIDISINILVSAFIICYVLLCVLHKGLGKNKLENSTDIIIKIGENEKKITAYKDTGNTLVDNITGRPVIVVSCESLKDIIPKELRFILNEDPIDIMSFSGVIKNDLKLRIINYKSIGNKSSMMIILTPTYILDKNKKKIDAVIGISREKICLAGCTAIMGV